MKSKLAPDAEADYLPLTPSFKFIAKSLDKRSTVRYTDFHEHIFRTPRAGSQLAGRTRSKRTRPSTCKVRAFRVQ